MDLVAAETAGVDVRRAAAASGDEVAAGTALALLEHDVSDSAQYRENRVLRVTLAGEVVYNRPTPQGGSS